MFLICLLWALPLRDSDAHCRPPGPAAFTGPPGGTPAVEEGLAPGLVGALPQVELY